MDSRSSSLSLSSLCVRQRQHFLGCRSPPAERALPSPRCERTQGTTALGGVDAWPWRNAGSRWNEIRGTLGDTMEQLLRGNDGTSGNAGARTTIGPDSLQRRDVCVRCTRKTTSPHKITKMVKSGSFYSRGCAAFAAAVEGM